MKLSHAAALALVGWYLMMPAMIKGVDAPFPEWGIVRTFDSSDKCEEAEADLVRSGRATLAKSAASKGQKAIATLETMSQCIATDDPRLKEK